MKNQALKVGGALCPTVFSARSGKTNSPSRGVRHAAANDRVNVDAFKVTSGQIKVEGFKVAAIGTDAINPSGESGQNPENEKPKKKIDKIKHVKVS